MFHVVALLLRSSQRTCAKLPRSGASTRLVVAALLIENSRCAPVSFVDVATLLVGTLRTPERSIRYLKTRRSASLRSEEHLCVLCFIAALPTTPLRSLFSHRAPIRVIVAVIRSIRFLALPLLLSSFTSLRSSTIRFSTLLAHRRAVDRRRCAPAASATLRSSYCRCAPMASSAQRLRP